MRNLWQWVGTGSLSELKNSGMMPDMRGISVYVMGVTTQGLTPKVWEGMRRFYARYFSMAGARLVSYEITRNRQID